MTRTEMMEKLEQYKRQDGTYHVRRLIADENPGADSLSLTFATFFGDDLEGEAEESELVKLARELNEQHGQNESRANDSRAKEIIAKTSPLTNEELNFLVETGHAENVYDDPDSNRPTGVVIRQQIDKPHADWETEEELAALGL